MTAATFIYRARDQRGDVVSGSCVAPSMEGAVENLMRQGLVLLDLERERAPRHKRGMFSGIIERLDQPKLVDLVMLCRQLASLISAGIPLGNAIKTVSDGVKHQRLRRALHHAWQRIQAGQTLSAGLEAYRNLFPTLFVHMIAAGETAGRLDITFRQLAANLERERETKRRLWRAFRYPLFVLVTMVAALAVINLVAIPALMRLFARLPGELPLPTRLLIATSDFLVNHGWSIVVGTAVALLALRLVTWTEHGAYTWDRMKLKIALLGEVLRMCALSRFCHSLAMLQRAGVPITSSISLLAEVAGNRHLGRIIAAMRGRVERGDTLYSVASGSGIFTPLVLQMLAVGEETGTVDELMEAAGNHYAEEAQFLTDRFGEALAPILLAGLAGMILVMAMGVFLPIWSLAGTTMMG